MTALPQGQLAQPGSATQPAATTTTAAANLARAANARSDFNIGFSGYRFNGDIGAYTVRFRHYDPTPGMCRWLERDPAGYQDGPSLYSYLGRNPMAGTDPYGLWGIVPMSVRINILKRLTQTRRLLQPGVYWGVRDLSGVPLGNHHYLLIVLEDTEDWGDATTQISPLQRGVILAGFNGQREQGEPEGKLVLRVNAPDDLAAVQELLGPPQCPRPGWDAELNRVRPPTGTSEEEFVMELIERTAAYVRNTSCGPESRVEYRLRTQNCATWVDGLLRASGVSTYRRREASNFLGIDWGEERGHQLAPQFGSPDWMSWSQ